jgi:hypothetical protein
MIVPQGRAAANVSILPARVFCMMAGSPLPSQEVKLETLANINGPIHL